MQYDDGITVLSDGIGYRTRTVSSEGPIKQYYYPLLNKVDTRVILTPHEGKFMFFASIVEESKKISTKVSSSNHEFKNEKKYYYDYPELVINKTQIQKNNC